MGSEVAKPQEAAVENNAPSPSKPDFKVDLADAKDVREVFKFNPLCEVGPSNKLPEIGLQDIKSIADGKPTDILASAATRAGITLPDTKIMDGDTVLTDGKRVAVQTDRVAGASPDVVPPSGVKLEAGKIDGAKPDGVRPEGVRPDAAVAQKLEAPKLNQSTLEAAKVGKKEGYHQVAERLLGTGFDHHDRKEVTNALRDTWKSQPDKAGQKHLKRGDQLLTQNNMDQVLNLIKDEGLRGRVRERLMSGEAQPHADRGQKNRDGVPRKVRPKETPQPREGQKPAAADQPVPAADKARSDAVPRAQRGLKPKADTTGDVPTGDKPAIVNPAAPTGDQPAVATPEVPADKAPLVPPPKVEPPAANDKPVPPQVEPGATDKPAQVIPTPTDKPIQVEPRVGETPRISDDYRDPKAQFEPHQTDERLTPERRDRHQEARRRDRHRRAPGDGTSRQEYLNQESVPEGMPALADAKGGKAEHMPLKGLPTMSAAQIDRVLQEHKSPAASETIRDLTTGKDLTFGEHLYKLGMEYGIDPAIALGFFKAESTFGKYGKAARTNSFGNIKGGSGFRGYDSFADGARDWFNLVSGEKYFGAGRETLGLVLKKYAPPSENNTAGYIRDVARDARIWSARERVNG
ncbi:MAG: hypothetical protein SGJ27_16700 [Candidatus Melainabacteria bacterium]|nr:hypothetical protein [Candidatus Melainabacteria bacterium]